MSAAGERSLLTAERLREDFDRAFAEEPRAAIHDRVTLLAIRVGGDPFALPLAALLGIHVDRRVVPLPTATPTLMGLASFRGALTPVHDLRRILGYPARTETRWLALIAAAPPVSLAFDAFEGQVSVPAAAMPPATPLTGDAPDGAGARPSTLTRGLVQMLDGVRPLIDIAAVLAAVGSRPRVPHPGQERSR